VLLDTIYIGQLYIKELETMKKETAAEYEFNENTLCVYELSYLRHKGSAVNVVGTKAVKMKLMKNLSLRWHCPTM